MIFTNSWYYLLKLSSKIRFAIKFLGQTSYKSLTKHIFTHTTCIFKLNFVWNWAFKFKNDLESLGLIRTTGFIVHFNNNFYSHNFVNSMAKLLTFNYLLYFYGLWIFWMEYDPTYYPVRSPWDAIKTNGRLHSPERMAENPP